MLDINKFLSNVTTIELKIRIAKNDRSIPKTNINRETYLTLNLLDPVNKILIIAIGAIPFEPKRVEKSKKLAPENI